MLKKSLVYLLLMLSTAVACKRITEPSARGEVIASVGVAELYASDVSSIFTPGLTEQDSIKLLESYIDMWVKDQIKIQEAEKLFGDSNEDIEKRVREYRNSLLSHQLEQFYIDRNTDTLITEGHITEYYDTHRAEFTLTRPIVKGRIVQLPYAHRQKSTVRELIASSGERYQDLADIAQKNNFILTDHSSWVDFSEFLAVLPASDAATNDKIFQSNAIQQVRAGDTEFIYIITARRSPGEVTPLDMVSESIRRIIYNQRRLEVVKAFEDSIYNAALDGGMIKIKING